MITYLSKIIRFDSIHVIGIVRSDNAEVYNVLTITKSGSKISVINKKSFASFDNLKADVDSKLPIILVLDGKGVLNKQIVYNNEVDMDWQKNIDYNSIYFTSYKTDSANFISFCRKNTIEETVQQFQSKDFQVLDIYVGSMQSALLQSSINNNIIVSGDLILEFENGTLTNYSKKVESENKEYVIGNDTINNYQLPLYGALLQFFVKSDAVEKTQLDVLNTEEIVYKKAFNYFGIAILAGFLLALTISFFLIQHYGTKTAELNLQSVYSSQAYKQIQDLEKQKEKQLAILNESGLMSSKFLSFFGYELMKTTPNIILLNELNIIPVAEKEIKADKKINFETRQIILKGESTNESAIHNWIESLREMKWIKKFEIISLKKDKKNISKFEIKITIGDV